MAGGNTSENLGPALVAVAWVFNVIAVIVVAARFYVRRNIIHRLSLDDWIILFTLVSIAPPYCPHPGLHPIRLTLPGVY